MLLHSLRSSGGIIRFAAQYRNNCREISLILTKPHQSLDVEVDVLDDFDELELLPVSDLVLVSDFEPASVFELALGLSSLPSAFFLSLKSVSYQPVPFRRKATLEICLLSVSWPHSGQRTRGASLIFCMTSRPCPHALHAYSYIGIFLNLLTRCNYFGSKWGQIVRIQRLFSVFRSPLSAVTKASPFYQSSIIRGGVV